MMYLWNDLKNLIFRTQLKVMKKYILLLLASLCLLPVDAFAQRKFSFDNGTFKICQFTDIHWKSGSPNCAQTEAAIRGVLKIEQPALTCTLHLVLLKLCELRDP